MFHLEDVLQLKDAEDVKMVVRRHAMTLVPSLCLAFILIVGPFFILFPLFSWGLPGVIAFIVLVGLGVLTAVRAFTLWNADVLIVTTLRLVNVDQRGVFARFVTETPLHTIQDVSWKRRGIVDTLFKVGTLSVQTFGSSPNIEAPRVAHPERVHERISDLRNATSPKRLDLPPETRERLRRLTGLIEHLPEQGIEQVEAFVRGLGKTEAMTSFLSEMKGDEKAEA